MTWQPTTSNIARQQRAKLYKTIRDFFAARDVLEVETPLLSQHTITDVYINGFATQYSDQHYYLQTSPEYAMKRLLAAGSGCIYQICKAFRDDECGRKHNPEFTMLEWYRINFNHHDLMHEVDLLLQKILQTETADKISYQNLFLQYVNIDIFKISTQELKEILIQKHIFTDNSIDLTYDDYLDLLLTHCIEPYLGQDRPIFIYDFPASQAALAKIRPEKNPVAERFEAYFHGIELANGFHELQDANEQQQRFAKDLAERKRLALPERKIDNNFIAALNHGLPNCSGVAMGLDRLLMLMNDCQSIQEVINFAWERA